MVGKRERKKRDKMRKKEKGEKNGRKVLVGRTEKKKGQEKDKWNFQSRGVIRAYHNCFK